jgi:hypothetical protein
MTRERAGVVNGTRENRDERMVSSLPTGRHSALGTVPSTDQRSERGDGPSGLWAVGHGVKEALLEARRAGSWCHQVGAVGHEMTGPVCARYSWHLLFSVHVVGASYLAIDRFWISHIEFIVWKLEIEITRGNEVRKLVLMRQDRVI